MGRQSLTVYNFQNPFFKWTTKIILDSVGEGEGGMIWENGIETCILSYVK